MYSEIRERELTLMEIARNAFEIYKQNFNLIALLTLVLTFPLYAVMPFKLQNPSFIGYIGYGYQNSAITFELIMWALFFAVVGTIVSLVLYIVTENTVNEVPREMGTMVKKAVKRLIPYFLTNLIMGLLLILALICLIIPGVILAIFYAFVPYIVVLRDKMGPDAMEYGMDLVKGNWWRVFGFTIAFGIANYVLDEIIALVGPTTLPVLLINFVLTAFISHYFAIANIVLFLNTDYLKNSGIAMHVSENPIHVGEENTGHDMTI